MAEETATPEAKEPEAKAPETTPTPESKVIEEARKPDAVQNLIDREREARKEAEEKVTAAEAKVKEYEDANKSEQEKLAEERDTLKREADEAKAESLRLRVASEKKLPAELVSRLRGSTEAELKADADELLKLVKPADATDFDGGARTTTSAKSPEESHNEALLALVGRKPN